MDGMATQAGMAILSGFDPLSLNPVLWLDGSDTSTMFDAVTGGSPVSDGGAVARWEDKSTNGNDATQSTELDRPTLNLDTKNSLAAIDFPLLTGMETTVELERPYTLVLVGSQRRTGNDRMLQATNRNSIFCLSRGANAVYITGDVRTSPLVSPNISAVATLLVSNAATTELYANGLVDLAKTSPASNDWGVLAIGAAGLVSGDGARADIYEVLAFPYRLTADDWQSLQIHLADKWAITLT